MLVTARKITILRFISPSYLCGMTMIVFRDFFGKFYGLTVASEIRNVNNKFRNKQTCWSLFIDMLSVPVCYRFLSLGQLFEALSRKTFSSLKANSDTIFAEGILLLIYGVVCTFRKFCHAWRCLISACELILVGSSSDLIRAIRVIHRYTASHIVSFIFSP